MTFGPRTEEDVRLLEVKTNFVWVYPFTGDAQGARRPPGDVHDEIAWVFPAEADVDSAYRGMYVDSTQATRPTSTVTCSKPASSPSASRGSWRAARRATTTPSSTRTAAWTSTTPADTAIRPGVK